MTYEQFIDQLTSSPQFKNLFKSIDLIQQNLQAIKLPTIKIPPEYIAAAKQIQKVLDGVANWMQQPENRQKIQEFANNYKYLKDIDKLNPELHNALLEFYRNDSLAEVFQFLSKYRSLPESEQYDFICDHINYHPEFFADVDNDINIIKSKEFSDDLNNILSSANISNKDKINKDIKELCKKHKLSNVSNINITININNAKEFSVTEEIKKQLISFVIKEAISAVKNFLIFIYFLIIASLIPQEPSTGEISAEQIRQIQHQTETPPTNQTQTQSQNSNIEIENQELKQSPQSPKTKLPASDEKQQQK